MDKKKTIVLLFLASAIFYAVAVIKMIGVDFSSGVIWLCLGSAFLCIGAGKLNQGKSKTNKTDDKK